MRWWVRIWAFALLMFVTAPARADDAADLKAKGDAALVSGNAQDALVAYKEAYAKNHDPALLYNMGRAHQNLGDLVAALDEYEAFDHEATPALRARVPGLPGLLKELRGKISQLAVSCNEEGATVTVRAKAVGKTPLTTALRVPAGHATVEVTKEGYFSYKTEVELTPGALAAVNAKLSSKTSSGLLVVTSPIIGALVAVDGASKESHELLRRGSKWDVMMKNMPFIGTLKAKGHIGEYRLVFVVQKENFHEMGAFVDLAKEVGADSVAFERVTNWGTFTPEQYAEKAVFVPTHPQYGEFMTAISDPRLRDPMVMMGSLGEFTRS